MTKRRRASSANPSIEWTERAFEGHRLFPRDAGDE